MSSEPSVICRSNCQNAGSLKRLFHDVAKRQQEMMSRSDNGVATCPSEQYHGRSGVTSATFGIPEAERFTDLSQDVTEPTLSRGKDSAFLRRGL